MTRAWSVGNNEIYQADDVIAKLRGMSWFGFETQDYVVNGLWQHSMDWYFELLSQNGVNALRIPYSAEWIHFNSDKHPSNGILAADPSLQGKSSLEILDVLFEKARQYGIVLLLDLHRLHKEYISELWYSPYDNIYTTDIFFETWFAVLDRYGSQSNLLGIDLLNEPHGRATFGSGDVNTDWKQFIEYAVPKITERYPESNWLIFIEGIEWGHTFSNYVSSPIQLVPHALMKRLVFSPHIYGKSVVPSTDVNVDSLHNQWNHDFGFLVSWNKTVVPGEWGGRVDIDRDWMTLFADYLVTNRMTNNFFWSLGPNSGDVAGFLLDDWTSIDSLKQSLLQQIQPYPSLFIF
jgi:endoglucanase